MTYSSSSPVVTNTSIIFCFNNKRDMLECNLFALATSPPQSMRQAFFNEYQIRIILAH